MPTYAYACPDCRHEEDVFQWYSEAPVSPCPACGSAAYRRRLGAGLVVCKGESSATTFGQQAEINARRVGKEGLARMLEERRSRSRGARPAPPPGGSRLEAGPAPWFRSGEVPGLPRLGRPLDLGGVGDPKKYIEEGQK